ncbi:MAG: YceI family protein [Bacteroidota bacterium]|nr:YceI family protein [Bacteroidota bacterium]
MSTQLNNTVNENITSTAWSLDPAHSRLEFSAKHMVISSVKGHFDSYNVNVHTDGDDFKTAEIEVTIDAGSINTGNKDRDNHLKSDDFFNAEKYPAMTFKASLVRQIDEEHYTVVGYLTIRGISKPIELDVEYGGTVNDPWGNTRTGFSLRGSIDRFDYDLKWNALMDTGGAIVGKTIKISGDIELVKQK